MNRSEKKENMSARKHAFLLFGLLFLSTAFFVSATDEMSGNNIVDDPDQDGLTTEEEKLYGTDPMNRDTDGDGYSDGVEVKGGYDPLKPAPGDKIVPETVSESSIQENETLGMGGDNLTDQLSTQIATLVQNAEAGEDGNAEVSLEELDAVTQSVLSGSVEEIVLPEVDMERIKVKKQNYDKYSDKKRDEEIREDVLEYLTVLGYIFANNSPKEFSTQDELQALSDGMVNDAVLAFSLGDFSQISTLAKNGEKMLEQVYDVEVPPQMLEVHVKAIKLAMYASQLNGDFLVSGTTEDPIRTISSLSKVQGLLNVVAGFVVEAQAKLAEYEITDIPIEL